MPKKFKILLVIAFSLIFTVIFIACNRNVVQAPTTNPNKDDENINLNVDDIKYEVQKTHDYPVPNETIKLESLKDWEEYKFNKSLDGTFIKEELKKGQIIYIIQRQLSSGSTQLSVGETYIKNNKLYADIQTKSPEIGTCDMAGAFYIFSCDKAITSVQTLKEGSFSE